MEKNINENNSLKKIQKQPYTIPTRKVLSDLAVDPEIGLTEKEAAKRRFQAGLNKLPEPQIISPLKLFSRSRKIFKLLVYFNLKLPRPNSRGFN